MSLKPVCTASLRSLCWLCLRSVALQTNRVFFGPGEVLINKGDAIRNIYYVCSGSLEVLKNEQVVAILGENKEANKHS